MTIGSDMQGAYQRARDAGELTADSHWLVGPGALRAVATFARDAGEGILLGLPVRSTDEFAGWDLRHEAVAA